MQGQVCTRIASHIKGILYLLEFVFMEWSAQVFPCARLTMAYQQKMLLSWAHLAGITLQMTQIFVMQANHFIKFAKPQLPYAMNRYHDETKRLYSVAFR